MPVLRKAFALLLQFGWLRPYEFWVIGNKGQPPGLGLIDAIQRSGPRSYPDIECWFARRALMRVEVDLLRWEAHPARTQEDVLRLIARTIELCGGVAPSIPWERPARRRGGWQVTVRP